MRLLTSYFNYMKNPSGRWEDMFDHSSVGQALFGYLTATLGWVILFNIGDGLSLFSLLAKLSIVFLAEVTVGYFMASLTGMFLSWNEKTVSSFHLFVLIGTAGFIKGLLIAWALICALLNTHLGGYTSLVLFLVFLLQFFYLVRGLKQLTSLSTIGAVGAWFAGIVPVGILLFLLGIFGIWGLALLF